MHEGLHATPIGGLLRGRPLTCKPETPVADVAAAMAGDHARAVVVLDAAGAAAGIVTDRDLRAKVVALRRDPTGTQARDVMSAPVIVLPETALAFEALLEMTRHEIHHLVVLRDGTPVGVVTSNDLVGLPASHPVVLARAIARAEALPDLAALAARVTELVRLLVSQGSRARDIANIVAELNDRLVGRVLALAEARVTARRGTGPPAPYAWLLFGSEGRREQTLRTDQDNGLVYADGADDAWYSDLAREAIDGLLAVGFPPCPGGAMASNPMWCQPLSVWEGYFLTWLEHPSPAHVLHGSMYFDVRPLRDGDPFGTRLRELLRAEAPRHPHFLSAMAREVVDRRLPRTIFGGIKVERRGPHRGTLDVKGAGSLQLVAAARIHALELGLTTTSTVTRLNGAAEAGIYPADDAAAIVDAFDHLLQLRLVAQLDRLATSALPDNRVDPRRLSPRDRLLLGAAWEAVTVVQATLRDRYRTDLVG